MLSTQLYVCPALMNSKLISPFSCTAVRAARVYHELRPHPIHSLVSPSICYASWGLILEQQLWILFGNRYCISMIVVRAIS